MKHRLLLKETMFSISCKGLKHHAEAKETAGIKYITQIMYKPCHLAGRKGGRMITVNCTADSCEYNDDGECAKLNITISDEEMTAAGFIPTCQEYREEENKE